MKIITLCLLMTGAASAVELRIAPTVVPEAVAVRSAPPPLRRETRPPSPFAGAVWVRGSWSWDGQWVWAPGYFAAPPVRGYVYVPPYYEHRSDIVMFVPGFWAPPGTKPGVMVPVKTTPKTTKATKTTKTAKPVVAAGSRRITDTAPARSRTDRMDDREPVERSPVE